jgi:hypothetical protein
MLAMNVKYNILRYMISFFHGIKTTGGAFYKPLFFDYPNDLYAYEYLDQNTMLGESIKFSFNPSMNFDEEAKFYFPEGRWCQVYPEEKEKNPCQDFADSKGFMPGPKDGQGNYTPLKNGFELYFLHMKAGAIVPYQEAVGTVLNVSGLNDLATSYRFGTPTTAVTQGYVAFDVNGSG